MLWDLDDPDDAAIAKTIIVMAHNLNMKVTAQGAETKDQLSFLRAHRCDAIQAYLFSKPLAEELRSPLNAVWEARRVSALRCWLFLCRFSQAPGDRISRRTRDLEGTAV